MLRPWPVCEKIPIMSERRRRGNAAMIGSDTTNQHNQQLSINPTVSPVHFGTNKTK